MRGRSPLSLFFSLFAYEDSVTPQCSSHFEVAVFHLRPLALYRQGCGARNTPTALLLEQRPLCIGVIDGRTTGGVGSRKYVSHRSHEHIIFRLRATLLQLCAA